jgi:hypothetical protein
MDEVAMKPPQPAPPLGSGELSMPGHAVKKTEGVWGMMFLLLTYPFKGSSPVADNG